jgi:hypothetical protein
MVSLKYIPITSESMSRAVTKAVRANVFVGSTVEEKHFTAVEVNVSAVQFSTRRGILYLRPLQNRDI